MLLVDEGYGADGGEGGCLGAEAVVAERDGLEAQLVGEGYLVVGEVTFGSDEYDGVVGWTAGLGHEERAVVVAVTDDFGSCRGVVKEGFDGSLVVDDGQVTLERLLHGADCDFLEAAAVEACALGVVGYERSDFVDAYFDSFLDEPLDAVGVLCGCDGDVEAVGSAMRLEVAMRDLDGAGRRVGREDGGGGECAFAVGNI